MRSLIKLGFNLQFLKIKGSICNLQKLGQTCNHQISKICWGIGDTKDLPVSL